jgi:hypothetical protein
MVRTIIKELRGKNLIIQSTVPLEASQAGKKFTKIHAIKEHDGWDITFQHFAKQKVPYPVNIRIRKDILMLDRRSGSRSTCMDPHLLGRRIRIRLRVKTGFRSAPSQSRIRIRIKVKTQELWTMWRQKMKPWRAVDAMATYGRGSKWRRTVEGL